MESRPIYDTQYILNNLPDEQRKFLLKRNVREDIIKFAGVDIKLRGRYKKQREDGAIVITGSLPLHYIITGPSENSLTLALKRIEFLLENEKACVGGKDEEDFFLVEKITIGIDMFPATFEMKLKLLGKNDENAKYIKEETGAVILLQGKGSGYREKPDDEESTERLHILVKYKTFESQAKARQLVGNLIETVQQDFIETYGKILAYPKKPEVFVIRCSQENVKLLLPKQPSELSPPPSQPLPQSPLQVPSQPLPLLPSQLSPQPSSQLPPQPSIQPPPQVWSQRPPKRKLEKIVINNLTGTIISEKILLGLDKVPQNFNLKSKIYGPGLTNINHISKTTNALLIIGGKGCSFDEDDESLEPPYILVKYLKPELKDAARKMILDLIDTIHKEFVAQYGTYPIIPQTPEIIPIKNLSSTNNISSSLIASESLKSTEPSEDEKSPKLNVSPTVSKFPRKDSTVESITSSPVPPPPPVISKSLPPDFNGVTSVFPPESTVPSAPPPPLVISNAVSSNSINIPSNFTLQYMPNFSIPFLSNLTAQSINEPLPQSMPPQFDPLSTAVTQSINLPPWMAPQFNPLPIDVNAVPSIVPPVIPTTPQQSSFPLNQPGLALDPIPFNLDASVSNQTSNSQGKIESSKSKKKKGKDSAPPVKRRDNQNNLEQGRGGHGGRQGRGIGKQRRCGSRDDKRCFTCHDFGHYGRDCPNKGLIKCYNCNRLTNHISPNCPYPRTKQGRGHHNSDERHGGYTDPQRK